MENSGIVLRAQWCLDLQSWLELQRNLREENKGQYLHSKEGNSSAKLISPHFHRK